MAGKINVSAGFCAAVLIMAWYQTELCPAFLLSVVTHELGHLSVLWLLKQPVRHFRLKISGAEIGIGLLDNRRELLCAMAGPMAGIVLGLALLRIWPLCGILSLCLSCGNLLPLYPLDGGRILRCLLSCFFSAEKVYIILKSISFVTAAAVMVAACWATVCLQAGIWPIFAALIMLWRTGEWEK